MVEFKIVVGSKGRSYSKALTDNESSSLLSKKIGDKIEGGYLGFQGYELEVTGGSDKSGFPMRYDLEGSGRKEILLTEGPCVKINVKGMRKKKTVVGNTIGQNTAQVNLKVTKDGKDSLAKLFGKEEKTVEAKDEQKIKEEKKD